jgi:hypothetical protein
MQLPTDGFIILPARPCRVPQACSGQHPRRGSGRHSARQSTVCRKPNLAKAGRRSRGKSIQLASAASIIASRALANSRFVSIPDQLAAWAKHGPLDDVSYGKAIASLYLKVESVVSKSCKSEIGSKAFGLRFSLNHGHAPHAVKLQP